MKNPYLEGMALVKQHSGTSGQTALAKCILSLYNSNHAFSMGEILGPLDERYTSVVLAMVNAYAASGETPELCEAGEWVYDNFPGLIELSRAMGEARANVRDRWEREREAEAEEEERKAEQRSKERFVKAEAFIAQADMHGCVEIKPDVVLKTSASMIHDQKCWGETHKAKNEDFTKSPYWLVDRYPYPIENARDLACELH